MRVIISVLLLAALVYAEPQCPSEQGTDWNIELLLRHDDCNKFYKCTFGQPVELQCSGDLYFNLETWQCDWQSNVNCEGRNVAGEDKVHESLPEPEPEVESPEVVEEETPEQVETEPELEPQPEPEREPDIEEEDVEEKEETVEEVEEEKAVEEAEQSPEEEQEASVEAEATETEEQQEEFQENGCPVNPHVHWLLPHEEDCNLFYYCVWGEKVLRQCADSLHFNRELQVCDWPANAGCAVSANKHYASRAAYRNLL